MTPDRPSPPVLAWTAEEVAYAVAVGAEVIEAKRKAGELKAVKIGRAWRYRPRDVRAWLDGMAQPTKAKAPAPDPRPDNVSKFGTPQAGTRAG